MNGKNLLKIFHLNLILQQQVHFVNFPFPLIIIGNEGNILWYNQSATSMLQGEDLLGINIRDIIRK